MKNKGISPLLTISVLLVLTILAGLPGCRRDSADGGHAAGAAAKGPRNEPAPSNRVEIPETVRRNLGITFAKVESRPIAQTIRVPGQFELQPDAVREYRTMLAGRVELLAKQYARVEPGTPLYRLASPEWRELQTKLTQAESSIRQSEAKVASIPLLIAAHRRHEAILESNIALWEERIAQLEKSRASGAVTGDEFVAAQNTLALHRAELAEVLEKEADLEGQIASAHAEHDAAHMQFRMLIATAAMLLGVDESSLCGPGELEEHANAGIHAHTQPTSQPLSRWRTIDLIEVRADAAGIVRSLDLTNGAWASAGSLVVATVQPDRLRFRAMAMQSDLTRLRDGLPGRIVPPRGGTIGALEPIEAPVFIGLSAVAQERTIELVAAPSTPSAWARSGISAYLEITTAGGQNELAVPSSCVIQDGLQRVIFRRDPRDPDKAIRMEADLGLEDGRWVAIQSGVREGDEIVLDGVYQLMIATSGSVQKGGHFHADGTFHAGEEEK